MFLLLSCPLNISNLLDQTIQTPLSSTGGASRGRCVYEWPVSVDSRGGNGSSPPG